MNEELRKAVFEACKEIVKEKGEPFQKNIGKGRRNIYSPSIAGALLLYKEAFALDLRLVCKDAKHFIQEPIPTFTNLSHMAKKVSQEYIKDGLSMLQKRFPDIFPISYQKSDMQVPEAQKQSRLNADKVHEYLQQGKTVSEIARIHNVTRQAVYQHIDKIKKKQKQDPYSCAEARWHAPKPSRNYNGSINWREYNDALVCRGKIFSKITPQLLSQWKSELETINKGKKGRPYKYARNMILYLMQIKILFNRDYRSLEGLSENFLSPIVSKVPDYSTICKRFNKEKVELEVYRKGKQPHQDVAIDVTGIKGTVGGQYRESKYGRKRKRFLKLHISVNIETYQTVGCLLTTDQVSDCKGLPPLLSQSQEQGKVGSVYSDAGYDSAELHFMLWEQEIKACIRPRKTMSLHKVQLHIEDLNNKLSRVRGERKRQLLKGRLLRYETLKKYLEDEKKWKKENNYGIRWAVEGRYSVFKRIFSERLFSRKYETKEKEIIMKLNLMNYFEDLVQDSRRNREVLCCAK